MLRLTWIEFFLRVIPEVLIVVWGINVVARKHLNISKYMFTSIVLALLVFFVRWLPISFGVHMIINMFLTISIMVIIGVTLIKALYSTFLIYFMLTLSEFLNMIILELLNIDTSIEGINPIIKVMYFSPSLIFLSVFITVINYVLKAKEGVKNVSC